MDFTQQGQNNGLFGNNGQAVQTPALTQLAQILQSMTPNKQAAQASPSQESYLTASAPSALSGGNTGLNIPSMINQAGNLQSLPWLNPMQNAASMGGAMAQAGGSSMLSSLASLFL